MNRLYYGDNLQVLRDHVADSSVDLIYLDPPFNSNRDYNVLFRDESENDSDAQILAFEDTWHWGPTAQETWEELVTKAPEPVAVVMDALRKMLGANQMMAYLVMMTARLLELGRVLNETGSIYLHCDPTASHYLKLVLDSIFGPKNFRNEIVWCYRGAGYPKRDFGKKHDTIFRYSKSDVWKFNVDAVRVPYARATIERFQHKIGNVRGNADYGQQKLHKKGRHPDDWWEIQPIAPSAKERISYPTQKPLALIERIIRASSDEGDLVLDPFCGCGTAVVAAERLKRRWTGIDITHLSVSMMASRLAAPTEDLGCNIHAGQDYEIIGVPTTVNRARQLALDDPFQFQFWANSLVAAKPRGGRKRRGADGGVDGVIRFVDGQGRKLRSLQALVQVKSGRVSVRDIRDLLGTMDDQDAPIGIFITLNPPTRPMLDLGVEAGKYISDNWSTPFDRVQILTVEQLLSGSTPHIPGRFRQATFKSDEQETNLTLRNHDSGEEL